MTHNLNLTLDWSTLAAVVGVIWTIGLINLIRAVKDVSWTIKKKDFTKKPDQYFNYYTGDPVYI